MQDLPLVSFVLIAYNQEKYIREAVEGAFAQTYSPLEIILSDDCSSDKTFQIMEEMVAEYKGDHKIILNRNEKNLGLGGHVNKVFDLSSGELLVMAAGDDISLPERTVTLYNHWEKNNRPSMLCSGWIRIDSNNEFVKKSTLPPVKYKSFKENHLILRSYLNGKASDFYGAVAAYSKNIKDLGHLDKKVVSEDLALFLRALLLNGACRIVTPLVLYRQHKNAITAINDSQSSPFRGWNSKNIATYKSFQKDIDYLRNKKIISLIDYLQITYMNTVLIGSSSLIKKWDDTSFFIKALYLFPMIMIFGYRKQKKFVINNLRKSIKNKIIKTLDILVI